MPSYTANELEQATGVDRRTIAYYVQEGLLPKVGRRGRRTRYPRLFRDRLLFVQRVRAAEEAGEVSAVSLSDIRKVFERVPPALIAGVADGRIAVTPELVSEPSTAFRTPGARRAALWEGTAALREGRATVREGGATVREGGSMLREGSSAPREEGSTVREESSAPREESSTPRERRGGGGRARESMPVPWSRPPEGFSARRREEDEDQGEPPVGDVAARDVAARATPPPARAPDVVAEQLHRRYGPAAESPEPDPATGHADEQALVESLQQLAAVAHYRNEESPRSSNTWTRIRITRDLVLSVRGIDEEDGDLVERVREVMRGVVG